MVQIFSRSCCLKTRMGPKQSSPNSFLHACSGEVAFSFRLAASDVRPLMATHEDTEYSAVQTCTLAHIYFHGAFWLQLLIYSVLSVDAECSQLALSSICTTRAQHTPSTHGAHTEHTRSTHGAHCKNLYIYTTRQNIKIGLNS